jgi:Peptidase family M23
MTALEIGKPRRGIGASRKLLFVILIALLIAGIYSLAPKFEWHKPQIKITPDTDFIGLAPIAIEITERGSGLKSVSVTLSSGGAEIPLVSEQYDQPVMQKKITVVSSKLAGVKEGPAIFRISARDRSLWNFFRGNETVLQKNVTIDITPPTIELIADDPYINFGGSGLIVYKPSADAVTSGIKIGDYFFPGYKGQTKDPAVYIAFFAHPYNVSPEEKAVLIATDKAGNTRQMKLSYTLKDVKYKKSTIPISDEFIQNKVAPLLTDVAARQGTPKDIFIKVNHELRKQNDEKIRAVGQKTANTAYHLGFDLSVTKRYPVEAANSGVVSFVGDLGIYGNAVIIDHGLGLSTLYGHLSSIDVKEGDQIKQRQILGKTGETGLAVGDHLHFGVYLQGVPVLPLEWWDPKWIRDHVTAKLNPSAVESPDESKPARMAKPARKRRR